MQKAEVLRMENVSKEYRNGVNFLALKNVTLTIREGEIMSIVGPSGSGKSTMLHLLGCLDKPTGGEVFLLGKPVSKMGDDELSEAREKAIGFVFQSFYLAPTLTVFKNVELPLIIRGMPAKERKVAVEKSLSAVGMSDKSGNLPTQLSGGQKQRVAIARALVNEPKVLLADEPTGNLDSKTSHEVVQFILALCKERGITIIFVTHDLSITKLTNRTVRILDGKIAKDDGNN